jgi:hypothetical protein
MWTLAVTRGATELQVSERLRSQGTEVFCPYTRQRTRVVVKRYPRTVFKAVVTEEAYWPRYLFANAPSVVDKDVRGTVPGRVTPATIAQLKLMCLPCGRVVRTSALHDYSIGDVLRFVEPSLLGEAIVTDVDDETLWVLVAGKLPARAHYSALEAVA